MTNQTKWTKGPWLIAEGSHDFVYALNDIGTNRFWLNIQSAGKGSADFEEVNANTNLIVAAPDLYDALETLVIEFESLGFNPYCDSSLIDQGSLDYVYSVLAKARGES